MRLRALKKIPYWLKSRLIRRHMHHVVFTDLKPGWHDKDNVMLHACFKLLVDFVEKEHNGEEALRKFSNELRDMKRLGREPFEGEAEALIDQANCQDEVLALYRWWTIERPADESQRESLMHSLYGSPIFDRVPVDGTDLIELVSKPQSEEWTERNKEFRALEDKIDEDEQTMLRRLIDIRRSLWT